MASCASPITHPDSTTLWGLAEGFGARRVAPVISGVGQRPEKAGYGLLPYNCAGQDLAANTGHIGGAQGLKWRLAGLWDQVPEAPGRFSGAGIGRTARAVVGGPATSCRSNTSGALVATTARGKIQSGAGLCRVWDRVYRPCTWVGVFVVHHPSTSEATRLQVQG